MFRSVSYLLAANMEAVALLVGAWWIGEWLNTTYPKSFTWYAVTFPIALIVIVHSWYLIFRTLLKEADEKTEQKIDKKTLRPK